MRFKDLSTVPGYSRTGETTEKIFFGRVTTNEGVLEISDAKTKSIIRIDFTWTTNVATRDNVRRVRAGDFIGCKIIYNADRNTTVGYYHLSSCTCENILAEFCNLGRYSDLDILKIIRRREMSCDVTSVSSIARAGLWEKYMRQKND